VFCAGTYLKTKLLNKSDAELGLGATASQEDGQSSRAALYSMLDWCKKEFVCPVDGPLPFPYKPGKPKSEEWKRKIREGAAKRKREKQAAAAAAAERELKAARKV
jgi:hypothetical protein